MTLPKETVSIMHRERPHRILMIDSEKSWRGGEGQLALLMRGLIARGFEVTLAAPPGSAIAGRATTMGIECLPLRITGGVDMGAAWRLGRYLRSGVYDVVHTHASHAHSVAFIALKTFLKRAGRPRFVVSRRVDFPVAQNGFSAAKYRHGVDAYLAISNRIHDVLVEGGIKQSKIELVPSGIDLNKLAGVANGAYLYEEFGLTRGVPIIGNIAALAPHKSQSDFIAAAKIVAEMQPKVKFFIVGEGPLKSKLEKQIAELGLSERFVMTGFRDDVLELLALFDCFVLSSYLEGLCTSIMDAQASGVPVVATNTGGIPDLVQHEKTGLLVSPRSPKDLAAAIVRMLEDRDLRDACIKNALDRSKQYDYHAMVSGTVDTYERVLGSHHNSHGQTRTV